MSKCLGFLGILAALAWSTEAAYGQGALHRLTANFNSSGEISTSSPPANNGAGGVLIFQKVVTVPTGDNTLYVTIGGTGDFHNGAQLLLSCNVNNDPCRVESFGGGATGWVALARYRDYNLDYSGPGFSGDGGGGAGDLHDNGFYYTWCKKVGAGQRNVRLRMASGNIDGAADPTVFIEELHVFVDSNRIVGERCNSDDTAFIAPTIRH